MAVPKAQMDYLQTAATANGNGTPSSSQGFTVLTAEIVETAGGTATCTFQGSFDGTNWYAVGYAPIVNATITRSVTGVSVTANLKTTYQILDAYPLYRASLSSISAATVTVRLYQVAV